MKRRSFCVALAALPVAVATTSSAQAPPARQLRVAWVSFGSPDGAAPLLALFLDGMRALGYVEGRNLLVERWFANGSSERLAQIAPDIARSKPDVVVAGGLAVRPLVDAKLGVPIVFTISADPVDAKLVASFARPGGDLTGMSLFTADLIGKRMELLKEVVPAVRRVAVIANPLHAGEARERDAARAAATRLGLAMHYLPAGNPAELDAALAEVLRARDDAIVVFADGFAMNHAPRFAEFSLRNRIPAVSGWAEFAKRGNLMSYGPVVEENYRRLASYVDKIHKGTRPGEIPIELPTKVELVVNAKTAGAIGITIPPAVLARADEVIR